MLGYKYRGLTAINRRKDRRIPISIPGMANGTSVLVKDVSLGGLAFIADKIKFGIGEDILLELHVLGLGEITIGASVVRVRDGHEYGVAFIGLSSDAFKLIETLELGQHRRHILKVA